MERSRKLVLTDWAKANDALNQYFEGNKSKLTVYVRMSRTTVTTFFKQEPVREAEFRKLCLALRLNWQEVSTVQVITSESLAKESQSKNKTDSFQQVREHCRQKILSQHSQMLSLNGEQVGVDQVYVDVWVLNRSPRTFQISQPGLLKTFDLRNDRLGLGDRIRRNPGFDVANMNSKLVILGKPGSGKTTFLKHLAVDWCTGKFQSGLIAVLIEFRRIQTPKWYLLDAIGEELGIDKEHYFRMLQEKIKNLKQSSPQSLEEHKNKEKQLQLLQQQLEELPLTILLKKGKLLVLMDGLDEVPTGNLRRDIQNQLWAFAEEYPKNRFVLTCRTQIMTSIPNQFTSVEVADFNLEQVQQFVQNWFTASGSSESAAIQQWQTLKNAVDQNLALKELTVTPVLLSLMCVVLQDEGEMPLDSTLLYKKGIKLLLSRWNDAKDIDGWEIGSEAYRQLSVEQKEELLKAIAAHKFENPKNSILFEQDEIADQITRLLHLTHRQEGVAVLKAIEAQHGLLVERADELWSFSHLTFQEYFTVQWLTQLPSEQLTERIVNPKWQDVAQQLVKSQQPADQFLQLIKQAIDRSVAHEPEINQILTWVWQKAEFTETPYKRAAIRAFYFVFTRDLALDDDLSRTRNIAFDSDLALDCDFAISHLRVRTLSQRYDLVHARAYNFVQDRSFVRGLFLSRTLDPALDLARQRACDRKLYFDRILTLALDLALDLTLDHNLALDLAYTHALASCLDLSLDFARKVASELITQLEHLRLPLQKKHGEFLEWWEINEKQWIDQLRQVMITKLNIGHDWRLTKIQMQHLQRYYDANKFLIKLINIEGAVSKSVRVEIEDTLLLPWDELKRRQPDRYEHLSSHKTQ